MFRNTHKLKKKTTLKTYGFLPHLRPTPEKVKDNNQFFQGKVAEFSFKLGGKIFLFPFSF